MRSRAFPGLVAVLGALAAGCASEGTQAERPAPARVQASIEGWRWAPDPEPPRAPAARERRERAEAPTQRTPERQAEPEPDPEPAATQADRAEPEPADLPDVPDLPGGDASLVEAEVLKNGIALPPLEAPAAVRAIFEAGNVIARSPYKWGGGHGRWQDTGYDCSGSVSYALAAAGLLDAPLASGPLMSWGKPGKGKWITIYSNPGHVFLVVAGVRFDTIARKTQGSRWIESEVSTEGYVARHPAGL